MTAQPVWKEIANLGDASPIEYGGYFVYRDETGQYTEEVEYLYAPDEDPEDPSERAWMVYRFPLDRCTLTDGILSDNPYHPLKSVWFAPSEAERKARPQDGRGLVAVAECMGWEDEATLREAFTSEDPLLRAEAYRAVAGYWGYEEFDSYPLTLTRAEVETRYPDYV